VSCGSYSGRLRDLIHALKYDRLRPIARQLGRMLAETISQLENETPAGLLVVPVPLHHSKHAKRGFNQARLLAFEAIRFLRKTNPRWRLSLAPGTLIRLRATNSQAGLTPRQRRLNMRGAFRVIDPAAVAGKSVLVVDDIFTTGATARAAARAFVAAGADAVWVATLARARRQFPLAPMLAGDNRNSFENDPGGLRGIGGIGDANAVNTANSASFANPQPASMYAEDQPSF
jgi:ComF family protein